MADPVSVPTVAALLAPAIARLTASGSGSPRLDAELLLAWALGTDRTGVLAHPGARVGDGPRAAFETAMARRERSEPVAYIRGFREFHGLAIATDARALIPRPETELLLDLALDVVVDRLVRFPREPNAPVLRIADVGTGSGAIAVALLVALRRKAMDGEVRVDAFDVSPAALDLARENAAAHGVAEHMTFAQADLLPADDPGNAPAGTAPAGNAPAGTAPAGYALICANLPYVASGDLAGLAPDLAFEPRVALDGGADGLELVRRLLDLLPGTLAEDGMALLEIGADQGEAIVREVAVRLPGWRCAVIADLAGLPRVARVRRTEPEPRT